MNWRKDEGIRVLTAELHCPVPKRYLGTVSMLPF